MKKNKIVELITFEQQSISKTIERISSTEKIAKCVISIIKIQKKDGTISWRFLSSSGQHFSELLGAIEILRIHISEQYRDGWEDIDDGA